MKRVAGLEAKVVALKDQPESVEVLVGQVRRLAAWVGCVDGDRAVSLAESIAEAAAREGHKLVGYYKEALKNIWSQEASPDIKSLLVAMYGSSDAQKASSAFTPWKKAMKVEGKPVASTPSDGQRTMQHLPVAPQWP